MRRLVLLASVIALSLTSLSRAAELTVTGAWTLNRDLTTVPDEREARRLPESGRRGGGGGGVGGRGGGGGTPGGRGGIGGRGGLGGFGGNAPNEDEVHKAQVIRRRMTEIPLRLIISRNGESVTIMDEIGRSQTLKADGKKQERVTGDGEFTSKTRFDGAKLVIEEDFGGPKLTTTYTPILFGGEIPRLEVTLTTDNMPGAARERLRARGGAGTREPAGFKRTYDLEPR